MEVNQTRKPTNKLHQVEITVAIVVALVLVLSFFKPTITGFVSADTYSQKLDLVIDKGTSFLVSAPENVEISAFKISGEVEGGIAQVYLDNMAGQRLLIYENLEDKKKGLNLVTGMATGGDFADMPQEAKVLEIEPLYNLNEGIGEIDLEELEVGTGLFEEACKDTCFIKMEVGPEKSYQMLVFLEDGATLKINEIVLTIVE